MDGEMGRLGGGFGVHLFIYPSFKFSVLFIYFTDDGF